MSFATPSVQTTNDRVFEGIINRFVDESDTLELQAQNVRDAFTAIESLLLGNNTTETIALARNEMINSSSGRRQLDLSTYNISKQSFSEFQKQALIVTEATSYALDVLIKVIESLRQSDVIDKIRLQNMSNQGNQTVIQKEQEGIFGRLKNFFAGFRSEEQRDFERAILLLEGKLQEIQGAKERWLRWKMQHLEFIELAVLFSESGKDIDHMYAALLTDVRNFYDMVERVLPTLTAGFRFKAVDQQKTFASIAGSMAQSATAAQQQQAMMMGMGMGMMPNQRPVTPINNNSTTNAYEPNQ